MNEDYGERLLGNGKPMVTGGCCEGSSHQKGTKSIFIFPHRYSTHELLRENFPWKWKNQLNMQERRNSRRNAIKIVITFSAFRTFFSAMTVDVIDVIDGGNVLATIIDQLFGYLHSP